MVTLKEILRAYRMLVAEDAAVNNVGSGHIAGAGVGPSGEPGVDLRRRQQKRRRAMWAKAGHADKN